MSLDSRMSTDDAPKSTIQIFNAPKSIIDTIKPPVFQGKNYRLWAKEMLMYLEARSLLNHITGKFIEQISSDTTAEETESKKSTAWSSDAKSCFLILYQAVTGIAKTAILNIKMDQGPKALWAKLESTYDRQTDAATRSKRERFLSLNISDFESMTAFAEEVYYSAMELKYEDGEAKTQLISGLRKVKKYHTFCSQTSTMDLSKLDYAYITNMAADFELEQLAQDKAVIEVDNAAAAYKTKNVCFICKKPGHMMKECTKYDPQFKAKKQAADIIKKKTATSSTAAADDEADVAFITATTSDKSYKADLIVDEKVTNVLHVVIDGVGRPQFALHAKVWRKMDQSPHKNKPCFIFGTPMMATQRKVPRSSEETSNRVIIKKKKISDFLVFNPKYQPFEYRHSTESNKENIVHFYFEYFIIFYIVKIYFIRWLVISMTVNKENTQGVKGNEIIQSMIENDELLVKSNKEDMRPQMDYSYMLKTKRQRLQDLGS